MPSYARGEQKVCFYFLHLNISTFVLESNHLNNVLFWRRPVNISVTWRSTQQTWKLVQYV